MSDRLRLHFESSLSFSSASYLDRQGMHNGRMSKCSINITRNTIVNDVYEISHIRTACGMKSIEEFANDPRSCERNLCNCVRSLKEKLGLQRDLNP